VTLLPLVLAWLAGLVLGLSAEARPLGLFLLFLAAFPAGAGGVGRVAVTGFLAG
jgi:hypothetical protein